MHIFQFYYTCTSNSKNFLWTMSCLFFSKSATNYSRCQIKGKYHVLHKKYGQLRNEIRMSHGKIMS